MSTRNDDEADQYEPHYEEEEDTRGIGYEDPPDYDDHEDHQRLSPQPQHYFHILLSL